MAAQHIQAELFEQRDREKTVEDDRAVALHGSRKPAQRSGGTRIAENWAENPPIKIGVAREPCGLSRLNPSVKRITFLTEADVWACAGSIAGGRHASLSLSRP